MENCETNILLTEIHDDDRRMKIMLRTAKILSRRVAGDSDETAAVALRIAEAQAEEEIDDEIRAASSIRVDLEHDGSEYRRGFMAALKRCREITAVYLGELEHAEECADVNTEAEQAAVLVVAQRVTEAITNEIHGESQRTTGSVTR